MRRWIARSLGPASGRVACPVPICPSPGSCYPTWHWQCSLDAMRRSAVHPFAFPAPAPQDDGRMANERAGPRRRLVEGGSACPRTLDVWCAGAATPTCAAAMTAIELNVPGPGVSCARGGPAAGGAGPQAPPTGCTCPSHTWASATLPFPTPRPASARAGSFRKVPIGQSALDGSGRSAMPTRPCAGSTKSCAGRDTPL